MSWLFSSRRARNVSTLDSHLRDLSRALPLWVDEHGLFVVVGDVKLPPGFERSTTELLVELPADYPLSPPGIGGCRVFVPPSLRFRGRRLRDIHENRTPGYQTPGFGPWA